MGFIVLGLPDGSQASGLRYAFSNLLFCFRYSPAIKVDIEHCMVATWFEKKGNPFIWHLLLLAWCIKRKSLDLLLSHFFQRNVIIGYMPIMIRSRACILNRKDEAELAKHGIWKFSLLLFIVRQIILYILSFDCFNGFTVVLYRWVSSGPWWVLYCQRNWRGNLKQWCNVLHVIFAV
jgi:hypothetical protein